ncbi:MAG: tetratricopeptide repeat protein [Myxococcota bacterium]|nr:tetratricopeptide repeat protein [Myxococcota bacterium]
MLMLFLMPSAMAAWSPQPEHRVMLDEGHAALTRYDLPAAVETLRVLVEADPTGGEARWRLGQALVHSNRPDDARVVLLSLQADFPERVEPPLALAWAGLAARQPDVVEVAATMASELSPMDPEPALLLSWSAAASGEYVLARQRLDTLAEVPERACVEARLALADTDYVEAAVALSRCEQIAPLLLVRDTQMALVRLKIPQTEQGVGPSALDLQLHAGARELLLADRPWDSLALLALLAQRYPRDLNTKIWQGRCFELLEQPERAMAMYTQVLASDWRALYLSGRAEGVMAWTGEEGVRAGIANVARRQALLLHASGQTDTARDLLHRVEEDVGSWPVLSMAMAELDR